MATAEFSKFSGILSEALSQHHLSGFEIVSTGIPLPPLALFIVKVQYSSGNSTQCSVVTTMGRKSNEADTCIHRADLLCCTIKLTAL